ncbi:hypothetical protein IJM86_03685 [bacterium]|nr:hypothetical protein [bacterium]
MKENVCMTFDQNKITELLKKYNDTQMGKLLTITKKLYKKKIKQQTKEYINPNQSIDDMPQDPKFLLNKIIKSYTSSDRIEFDKITYRDLAKWKVIIDHSNEDTIDLNTLINS